jgi:ribosomal protein L17
MSKQNLHRNLSNLTSNQNLNLSNLLKNLNKYLTPTNKIKKKKRFMNKLINHQMKGKFTNLRAINTKFLTTMRFYWPLNLMKKY